MTNLTTLTKTIIDTCMAKGADMAKCAASKNEVREFNIDGGKFSLFRTLYNNAVGITVFKDGKKGSMSINRFDDEAIEEAINACFAAAEAAAPDDAWDLCHEAHQQDITDGCPVCDTEKLFDRTEELKTTIEKEYPLILMEQMIVDHNGYESVFRTSYGGCFRRVSGSYQVSLMFSAHEGEIASSFCGAGVTVENLDTPFIELGNIRQTLADVEKQIHTEPVEGKFVGTMVLPPDALSEFVGSALGNFVSDGSLIDGTSIWKDALGTQVADDSITISSKPHDPRIIGGSLYTADGFVAEDYDIIKNGVLENFMLSLYAANKTGNRRAPNDAWDLVIENGDTPYDDIIKNIERGIIVGRFSGGSPNSKGDFSGVAKNSFLVENGKITKALRETMINGNLADLFKNVIAISKETLASGGSVLPTIAFGGVTVSGK